MELEIYCVVHFFRYYVGKENDLWNKIRRVASDRIIRCSKGDFIWSTLSKLGMEHILLEIGLRDVLIDRVIFKLWHFLYSLFLACWDCLYST